MSRLVEAERVAAEEREEEERLERWEAEEEERLRRSDPDPYGWYDEGFDGRAHGDNDSDGGWSS